MKSRSMPTIPSNPAIPWWNYTAISRSKARRLRKTHVSTNHQLHETIEITHGFTDWFETGFYIFTSAHNGQGVDWVGDHIRPRFRIPPK